MSVDEAKKKFYDIMRKLHSFSEQEMFLLWVEENWDIRGLLKTKEEQESKILHDIALELRKKVPESGVLASEKILKIKKTNSVEEHLDEFMFDDEFMEEKVMKYYCGNCKGRNIKRINFITHSFSYDRLRYIFNELLYDLNGDTIVDLGSRAGVVLYAAYLYTKVERIIGIEMNQEWCHIQQDIVNKFELGDRIQIINSDLRSQPEIVQRANLMIINNVFEYFTDIETERQCWEFIRTHLKIGAYLVVVPKIQDALGKCKANIRWSSWLKEVNELDETPYEDIGLYEVIS